MTFSGTDIFFNNTLFRWLEALLFFAGGGALSLICFLVTGHIHRKVVSKTKTEADDIILRELRRPLCLAIAVTGLALAFHRLELPEQAELWGSRLVNVLYVITVSLTLARIFDALILKYVPHSSGGLKLGKERFLGRVVEVQPVLRRVVNAAAWIAAVVFSLRAVGFNISAVLTGLGLGGAALALASKDTLANFFGAITVFFDKPFRLRDRIKISGYEGVIVEMNLRTSRILTDDKRVITIPNSLFSSTPIENFNAAEKYIEERGEGDAL